MASLVIAALALGGILNTINTQSAEIAVLKTKVATLELARETDRGEVNTVKSGVEAMRSDLKEIKQFMYQLAQPQTRLAGGKQ